ncbi:MAG: hypothetical protein ACYDH2_15805 [Anaerolineaceae bacterium]
MKTRKLGYFLVAALLIFAMSSCDVINSFIADRTRVLSIIQIYNSNQEITNKLKPNDTLFVEVQGLKPYNYYTVKCLDPENKIITKMTAQADEDGVIAPSALWYDIGFEKKTVTIGNMQVEKAVLNTSTELGLRAFNIQVTSDDSTDTNLKLPFFIVYNPKISRPEPIVMAGRKADNGEFVLENSFKDGEELFVKVANLEDLPLQVPTSNTARVYIVPFKGSAYNDGDSIGAELKQVILYQDCTVAELKAGIKIERNDGKTGGNDETTNGNSWATIPAWAAGKAFSVIVDVNNNGLYDVKKDGTTDYYLDGIDGNGVAGFIVVSSAPPLAELKHLNLASSGIFQYDYNQWQWDYAYVDQYKLNGAGTRYSYDWQYGGYGVKAIWNPYINWGSGAPAGQSESRLYYGTYIKLFIIKASDVLSPNVDLNAAPGTRMLVLPVQYGCYNGCGQQTIWRAPIEAAYKGNYKVFLDMNNDLKVSDNDIVDDLHRTETAPSDGVGFQIVD